MTCARHNGQRALAEREIGGEVGQATFSRADHGLPNNGIKAEQDDGNADLPVLRRSMCVVQRVHQDRRRQPEGSFSGCLRGAGIGSWLSGGAAAVGHHAVGEDRRDDARAAAEPAGNRGQHEGDERRQRHPRSGDTTRIMPGSPPL